MDVLAKISNAMKSTAANQASWGVLTWGQSAKSFKVLAGSSMSQKLSQNTASTVEGQSPTNSREFEPQSFSVSYTVAPAVGVTPLTEWAKVSSQLGKKAPFLIKGKLFAAPVFMLDSADFSITKITNGGEILLAEITLNFSEEPGKTEEPAAASSASSSAKTTTSTTAKTTSSTRSTLPAVKASSTAEGISNIEAAYSTRPTAADTSAKLNNQ